MIAGGHNMQDNNPRLFKMLDALSQLGNVAWPFWPHQETTANESISGRCFREGRGFARVVDALFFWQRNPGHCERAHLADVDRAQKTLDEWTARHD